MKGSRWWILVYVLAVFIILGRIGNVMNAQGPVWKALLSIRTPLSPQAIGYIFEGLVEDFIVFLAIRHIFSKDKLAEPKGLEPS
jgi:hypothetical protein